MKNIILSASMFKMVLGILIVFVLCSLFVIPINVAIVLSIIFLFLGIIFTICKKKNTAFYLITFSIGLILFSNTINNIINFPDKIIPSQKSIVYGEVSQVLTSKEDRIRCIVSGCIDSKSLPKINDEKILLTLQKNKYQSKLANVKFPNINVGDTIYFECKIRLPQNQAGTTFDEKQYAKALDVNWIGYGFFNKCRITGKCNNQFQNIINLTKNRTSIMIDSLFSDKIYGFVQAIVLADKSNLDNEIKQSFSLVGVSHLLALSGLHIGIITGILFLLLSFIPINYWIKFALFSLLITFFVILIGYPHTAIRAGGMSILFMFGKTIQRKSNFLNVISIVVFVSLLYSPAMIYSISFQMSLLSIFGIFIFNEIFNKNITKLLSALFNNNSLSDNRIISYLIRSLSLTFAATIIINPLIVYYFHTYSFLSPIANLIIIPIFSLGLIFALIAIIFGFIYFPIGVIYAGCVELLLKICINIADFTAKFSYSPITNANYLLILSIIISFSTFYILNARKKKQIIFRIFSSALVIVLLIFNFSN